MCNVRVYVYCEQYPRCGQYKYEEKVVYYSEVYCDWYTNKKFNVLVSIEFNSSDFFSDSVLVPNLQNREVVLSSEMPGNGTSNDISVNYTSKLLLWPLLREVFFFYNQPSRAYRFNTSSLCAVLKKFYFTDLCTSTCTCNEIIHVNFKK